MKIGVKIKNLKCFGEIESGFDEIQSLNLIIGRNNVGKSTLLDLIEALTSAGNPQFPNSLWNKGNQPEIILNSPLLEDELRSVFPESTSRGTIRAANHWLFAIRYIGRKFTWRYDLETPVFLSIDEISDGQKITELSNREDYLSKLAKAKKNPFEKKIFRKIAAERDIQPEVDNPSALEVAPTGAGATNIIQNYLNQAELRSELVQEKILGDLNSIYNPDSNFTEIVCQKYDDLRWEIYLTEDNKGRVALSNSGSSLKTIVLILISLYLIPKGSDVGIESYIYGIEEPENNLHPALLRRLLLYLYDLAINAGCIFFITTHSHIAIDLLNAKKSAQIVHTQHNGDMATTKTVRSYMDNHGILDDLDIRASDLLQANSVVWVEGPSDRVYVNEWIRIWSGGELIEGVHYQCVFYGGRLLSHLSADVGEEEDSALNILRVNRRAAVLADSDKKTRQTPINQTKKRICHEIETIGGFTWITKGREIENYIPTQSVQLLLGKDTIGAVPQYESFFDYLDSISSGLGSSYARKKPKLAEEISALLKREFFKDCLDLANRVDELVSSIRTWNKTK